MPYKLSITKQLRICRHFGIRQGLVLIFRIILGRTNQMSVPGLVSPITLRPNTTDIDVFFQIFLDREYDFEFHNPTTIIDGGANIGLFAVLLNSRYPEAKIICLEPDDKNFEALVLNTKYTDRIVCLNAGIWSHDTNLQISPSFQLGEWGVVVEESESDSGIVALSLETIFRRFKLSSVDVVKLDIESSEKEVFSVGYESWLPNVRMLVIELHDRIRPGCSRPVFAALNDSFESYSFNVKGENLIFEQR